MPSVPYVLASWDFVHIFPDPAFCRSYVPDREQYQPSCLQKWYWQAWYFLCSSAGFLQLITVGHTPSTDRFRIIIH